MIPIILMVTGGALWLTGELWGAFFRKGSGDTLSEGVWLLQRKWWPVRVLVALFLVWLGIHLWFGVLPT